MIDAEQKSNNILNLITKMLANLLQIGETLQIQTPSFIINYYKLQAYNLPTKFNIANSIFTLPSFSNLTSQLSNQTIILRVGFV